ncbi:MAG: hypothetical protein ABL962_21470, partial [Fimbriimonadaceae bacterium]
AIYPKRVPPVECDPRTKKMLATVIALASLQTSNDRLYVSVGSGTPSEISASVVTYVSDTRANSLIRRDLNDKLTVFYDPEDEGLRDFRVSAKLFNECEKSLKDGVISSVDLSESSRAAMVTVLNSFGDPDFSQPANVLLVPQISVAVGPAAGLPIRLRARQPEDWGIPVRVTFPPAQPRRVNPLLGPWVAQPRFVFRSRNKLSPKEMGLRMGQALEVYEQALATERVAAQTALCQLSRKSFAEAGLGDLYRITSEKLSLSQLGAKERAQLVELIRGQYKLLDVASRDEAEQTFLSKKHFSLSAHLGFGVSIDRTPNEPSHGFVFHALPFLNGAKKP